MYGLLESDKVSKRKLHLSWTVTKKVGQLGKIAGGKLHRQRQGGKSENCTEGSKRTAEANAVGSGRLQRELKEHKSGGKEELIDV